MRIDVSIIIVNYRVKKELFNCISSILDSDTKVSYEVIVVDNDERQTIAKSLREKFPSVRYIKNSVNNGYGGGNNLGASLAKGENLFFLNPDTVLEKGVIDELVKFVNKDKKIGIVAPLLLNVSGEVYPLQGTKELTPIVGVFALSFINKLFPNNSVSRKFWMKNWDKNRDKEVEVVPGTAFLIKKDLFEKVGKFDERFFLYFEEFDLCKRVKALGYRIFIDHSAKVIHIWESSTKQVNTMDHFSKSRFLYFKKHFGLFKAMIVRVILGLNKYSMFAFLALVIAGFLRLYKLNQWMIFIGDQGWFYLSARNMVINHVVPLVGIPSSVVWLRQGPLATYMIAFGFLLGRMSPVAPGILFAFLDVITVFLVYYLGKAYFNRFTGIFSAFLYATSTLIVVNARMPYHTSSIPLLSCIFFALLYYLFVKRNQSPFFLFLSLGLLIQLELSNAVLAGVLIILYFLYKPEINKNNFIQSVIGLIVGILPFILYDTTHRFVQTLGLPLWIINRTRLFFGLTVSGNSTTQHFPNAIALIYQSVGRIIFPPSNLASTVVFLFACIIFVYSLFKTNRNARYPFILILLWVFVPLLSYGIHSSPGSAYFPLVFVPICIVLGYAVWYLVSKFKPTLIIFILIIIFNVAYFFQNSFFIINSEMKRLPPYGTFTMGLALKDQAEIASEVVKNARGNSFQLKGGGFYGIFESNIDNYRYLVLYEGGKITNDSKTVYTLYIPSDKIKKNEELIYRSRFIQISKKSIL